MRLPSHAAIARATFALVSTALVACQSEEVVTPDHSHHTNPSVATDRKSTRLNSSH